MTLFKSRHLYKYNNVVREKTLIILGNGSSLNNTIFQSAGDFMVVNRFILSELFSELKPKFYVLADPFFFTNDSGNTVLKAIYVKTQWKLQLFIPIGFRDRIERITLPKNEFITVKFFTTQTFCGFKKLRYLFYRNGLAIPRVQNVLVASIFIGILSNYKIIELYGVEHSWTKFLFVNDFNEVCLNNIRFFEDNNKPSQTFKEIHNNEDFKFHEVLRLYAYMFESYWDLEEFSRSMRVDIINKTYGSFIDAFKR